MADHHRIDVRAALIVVAWLLLGILCTIAGLAGVKWSASWAMLCGMQCGIALGRAAEAARRRRERRRG